MSSVMSRVSSVVASLSRTQAKLVRGDICPPENVASGCHPKLSETGRSQGINNKETGKSWSACRAAPGRSLTVIFKRVIDRLGRFGVTRTSNLELRCNILRVHGHLLGGLVASSAGIGVTSQR